MKSTMIVILALVLALGQFNVGEAFITGANGVVVEPSLPYLGHHHRRPRDTQVNTQENLLQLQ